ncbi:MAG: hypothetical protein WB757_15920 [Candidatus Cybelea sp.]|jgi:hypothetical protein
MRAFGFSYTALNISLLAALLSACGARSSVPVAAGNAFAGATGAKHHQKFSYTGSKQTFIVPAGVTRLTVIARGGKGPGGYSHGAGHPGFPGRVYAVIRVHPGEKLYIFVAGPHGFGGGGVGGGGYGFGGGASDVRMGGDTLKDRIIVAAGGGEAGDCGLYCYADGGDGGGLNGQQGSGGDYSTGGGGGGTQIAGGSGGAGGKGKQSSGSGQPGGNGALGLGGNGGAGGQTTGSASRAGFPGGGGGGGYYGGGGGGGSSSYVEYSYYRFGSGGGGGGSSYVEPSAITSRMWAGWRGAMGTGEGQILFSWK